MVAISPGQRLQLQSAMPTAGQSYQPAYRIILAGCHGWAGTTTLTRLLGKAGQVLDGGRQLAKPGDRPLIGVTRGNVGGATAATGWLNAAQRGGIFPSALVVVGDGPFPEHKSAVMLFRLLEVRLRCGIVRFPYVERWRYCIDEDPETQLPRSARKALAALQQFAASLMRH